ncbi:L,D-transpeptidase family protein [Faunimonas pinastri]|uniref:L,D-transpeptidase family protein n=1 Tax=Faunimonas pinastri TaxID=1855383 RepID=UPI00115F8922|nr:L,D-transpeptidase family protein [Faunimonas pinastri]
MSAALLAGVLGLAGAGTVGTGVAAAQDRSVEDLVQKAIARHQRTIQQAQVQDQAPSQDRVPGQDDDQQGDNGWNGDQDGAPDAPDAQPDTERPPPPYVPPVSSQGPADPNETLEPGQPAQPSAVPSPAQQSAADSVGMRAENLTAELVNSTQFHPGAEQVRGVSPLLLKTQVLLDRANASPGVIDGRYGKNVSKAISSYQQELGLPVDGKLSADLWNAIGGNLDHPILIDYTVTPEDVAGPFYPSLPHDYAEQAKLPNLGYRDPWEELAERFHMDEKLFREINHGRDPSVPGTVLTVADTKGPPIKGVIARIEADKKHGQVRAYDDKGWLVVAYPATIGSSDTPSPSGEVTIRAVAQNPVYYYSPSNFVQGNNTKNLQLPPGPNNPVGMVFIALSKPTYGIHGTPEPSAIDKTFSHGCVRLTNWDAEELSKLVHPGIPVVFTE